MLHFLGQLAGIIVVNLVLSGDNAVVIGMAARRLPQDQRSKAIVLGGVAAVGLRVIFTLVAAWLLQIPLLEAAGGIALVWIAIVLLKPESDDDSHIREGATLGEAVRTIIIADLAMSLDNILAIGGVANGRLVLLIMGLVISIPIVLLGSGLVTWLLGKLPLLAWVGAAVLAYAAGDLIVEDSIVGKYVEQMPFLPELLPFILVAFVLGVSALLVWHSRRQSHDRQPEMADRS